MKIEIEFDVRAFQRTPIKKRIKSQFNHWVKAFDLKDLKMEFKDE